MATESSLQVPQIRSFQLDSGSIGNVSNSINLFQGNVNLPITLVSLPGKGGMQINVSAFYQSTVKTQISTFNRDYPTSILGAGWSLPIDQIVWLNPQSGSDKGNKYMLISGEDTYALIQSTEEVNDDGYIEFMLQDYDFSKIKYYPEDERWEVVKTDGNTWVYGGGLKQNSDGGNTSLGDSVQWMVKWRNWNGSSDQTIDQEQIAKSWNISKISNNWDQAILFTYTNVYENVNESGLPYTKASYLGTITDIYNRQVIFNYADKNFSEDIQEFQDPNKVFTISDSAPPSNLNNANAYQSCYETWYLDNLQVNNESGESIFTIQMTYDIENVVDSSAELYKRFLTSITKENPKGDSLPGMSFNYMDSESAYPGALETIIYPDGGIATYSYEQSKLSNDLIKLNLSSVNGRLFSKTTTPRIWWGLDYAVIALYDTSDSKLFLSVYSWAGRWKEFACGTSDGYDITSKGFDSLTVNPQDDYFVMFYKAASNIVIFRKDDYHAGYWLDESIELIANTPADDDDTMALVSGSNYFVIYDPAIVSDPIYSLNNAVQGYYWAKSNVDNDGVWESLSGHLPTVGSDADIAIQGGDNFYIVYSSTGSYNFNLYYLDCLGKPNIGSQFACTFNVYNDSTNNDFDFWWTLGDSFAVATYITKFSESDMKYEVQIFRWDNSFVVTQNPKIYTYDLTLRENDNGLNDFIAQVINNSLVASGGNLLRFNGDNSDQGWAEQVIPIKDKTDYQFAYDSDIALVAGDDQTQSIEYNPNANPIWQTPLDPITKTDFITGSDGYFTLGNTPYFKQTDGTLLKSDISLSNNGAIKNKTIINRAPRFMVCESDDGSDIYVANLANGAINTIDTLNDENIYVDFTTVTSALSGLDLASSNSLLTYKGSSFDEAEGLTLYQVLDHGVSDNAIMDYRVCNVCIDDGYSPDGLQINKQYTYFDYNDDTAVFCANGEFIQYAKVTSIQGGVDNGESIDCPYGYTEQYYFNGLDPDHTEMLDPNDDGVFTNANIRYSALSGYLIQSNIYNSNGEIVSLNTNYWWVKTILLNGNTIGNYIQQRKNDVVAHMSLSFTNSNLQGMCVLSEITKIIDVFNENNWPVSTNSKIIMAYVPEDSDSQWWIFCDSENQNNFLIKGSSDGIASVYYGITNVSETEYNDSNLPIETTAYNRNQIGEIETTFTTTTYAYENENYQDFIALNLLAPTIQQKVTVANSNTGETTTTMGSSVTTWKNWGDVDQSQWAVLQTYQATNIDAADQDFPFDTNAPSSSDWLKTSEAQKRMANGFTSQSEDVAGIVTCNTFDSTGEYPIGTFTNASLEEVDSYGFEDYEDAGNWTFDTSTCSLLDNGDAHTGNNSMKIIGDENSKIGLKNSFPSFNKISGHDTYLLSCWVRTENGFSEDTGAAYWEVSINGNSTPISVEITDSKEVWSYISISIDVSDIDPGGAIQLDMLLYSQKTSAYLLVDNLCFTPYNCVYSTVVYDSYYWLVIASLVTNGVMQRSIYDRFQRTVAAINPEGQIKGCTSKYYSRSANDDAYYANDPNSKLSIGARSGGAYTNFSTGDNQWQSVWKPDDPSKWSVKNNELTYVPDAHETGTITFVDSDSLTYFGLYFRLDVNNSKAPALTTAAGIKVGSSLKLQWNPSSGAWELFDGETTIDPLRTLTTIPTEWLMLIIKDAIFFYADNVPVYACLGLSIQPSGDVTIFAGDNFSISDLSIIKDPIISTSYTDGTSRARQSQLQDSKNVSVSENIYNPLGKNSITTKWGQYLNTVIGFQNNFVNSFDWDSGIMGGDLVDYTQILFPDDYQYPYSRVLYDDSPRGIIIAKGKPGQDLAITDVNNLDQCNIRKYQYAAKADDDDFANLASDYDYKLPAGQYIVKTTTNENGIVSTALKSRTNNPLFKRTEKTAKVNITTASEYDEIGRLILSRSPNYFTPPSGNADDWVTTIEYDFLGWKTRTNRQQDVGEMRQIYDTVGRLRFALNSNGAAADNPYILYWKYDDQGRAIEEGYYNTAWDEDDLQAKADKTSWPTTTSSWRIKRTYDGDGSEPYQIGRLISVSSNNSDSDDADVIETYSYDVRGNVLEETLQVNDYNSTAHATFYQYDQLKNIIQISYPSTDDFEVTYAFNSAGRLAQIGNMDQADAYAAYTYNPDGTGATESLNNAATPINRSFAYNSPSWLVKTDDDFFTESIQYLPKDGSEGYYNGNIAEIQHEFKWDDAPEEYEYDFEYDNMDQLISAQNDSLHTGNIGTSTPVTYDDNGNFDVMETDTSEQDFTYIQGTNKTQNQDGSDNQDYGYDANGNIILMSTGAGIETSSLGVTYDAYFNLASSIQIGIDDEVSFQYNGSTQRVLKQVNADSTILYLRGLQSYPLVEKSKDSSGETEVYYIRGPKGLLAVNKKDGLYFVLKDHLGSTRVVVEAEEEGNTVVASCDFDPFGNVIRTSGDTSIVPYRFTGQEYDAETGLLNFRARLYDTRLCRFIAPDPLGQSSSYYIYAGNNPLIRIDPTGMSWLNVAGATLGIAEVFAGVAITGFTFGGASALGSALIGAGISQTVYSIQTAATGESFSWNSYGESAAVGAVSGLAGFGVGNVGLLGDSAAAGIVSGSLGGAASGVAGQLVGNAITGESWDNNLGSAAISGAIIGAIAGGIGSKSANDNSSVYVDNKENMVELPNIPGGPSMQPGSGLTQDDPIDLGHTQQWAIPSENGHDIVREDSVRGISYAGHYNPTNEVVQSELNNRWYREPNYNSAEYPEFLEYMGRID